MLLILSLAQLGRIHYPVGGAQLRKGAFRDFACQSAEKV